MSTARTTPAQNPLGCASRTRNACFAKGCLPKPMQYGHPTVLQLYSGDTMVCRSIAYPCSRNTLCAALAPSLHAFAVTCRFREQFGYTLPEKFSLPPVWSHRPLQIEPPSKHPWDLDTGARWHTSCARVARSVGPSIDNHGIGAARSAARSTADTHGHDKLIRERNLELASRLSPALRNRNSVGSPQAPRAGAARRGPGNFAGIWSIAFHNPGAISQPVSVRSSSRSHSTICTTRRTIESSGTSGTRATRTRYSQGGATGCTRCANGAGYRHFPSAARARTTRSGSATPARRSAPPPAWPLRRSAPGAIARSLQSSATVASPAAWRSRP